MCDGGIHSLLDIMEVDTGYGSSKVVRWCEICGAVVIDMDYDGRTNPGRYMSMMIPLVTKDYHNNHKKVVS